MPLVGSTGVESMNKTADLNIDKLFLNLDILKENIVSASRGEAASHE